MDKKKLEESREARRKELEEDRLRQQQTFTTREIVVPERIDTPHVSPRRESRNFQSELLRAYREPLNHIIRDVRDNQSDALEEIIIDYIAKYPEIANNPAPPEPPQTPPRRRRLPGEKVGDYYSQFTSYLRPDLLAKWERIAATKPSKKVAFNEAVWDYFQKYAEVLRKRGIDAAELPKR